MLPISCEITNDLSQEKPIHQFSYHNQCPTCAQDKTELFLENKKFPTFLFPMDEVNRSLIAHKDLVLNHCQLCGHVFQPQIDLNLIKTIYTEYYAHYPFDDDQQAYPCYKESFYRIFDLLWHTQHVNSSDSQTLLEIGCSKLKNLEHFLTKGMQCIAVDPSPINQQEDLSQRVHFISGFYEEVTIDKPVHWILSRFNLEHIVDINRFMCKMVNDLADQGKVLIQVPNINYYLNHQQPLFAAHEHIHYFSASSLYALFQRYGFSLVTLYEADQPSIIACFQKNASGMKLVEQPLIQTIKNFLVLNNQKLKQLRQKCEAADHIIAYGSGLSLIWLLYELGESIFDKLILIDDNQSLWCKYPAGYAVCIQPPSNEIFNGNPLVLLTLNRIYHNKVMAKLKEINLPMEVIQMTAEGLIQTKLQSGI